MKNLSGRKRDFVGMQERRIRAARLLESGMKQAEVARRVSVSREAVRQWVASMQRGGIASLNGAGRAGRPSRLGAEQVQKIEQGLKAGPEALGYSTSLWTLQRVNDLVHQQTGLRYHRSHIWRILRGLGWSCQRPTGRAIERDERAIRLWKKQRWPEI